MRADIEKLAQMGFNLIQIERGVWDIQPEEGQVNLKPIEEDVLPVLRRAAAANVKVDYLISPHYMPEWVYRKYPHLRQPRDGFIQYSLFAPESLTVLREYIGHFAPLLKDQPALLITALGQVLQAYPLEPWATMVRDSTLASLLMQTAGIVTGSLLRLAS